MLDVESKPHIWIPLAFLRVGKLSPELQLNFAGGFISAIEEKNPKPSDGKLPQNGYARRALTPKFSSSQTALENEHLKQFVP